jgi:hypothetical protein
MDNAATKNRVENLLSIKDSIKKTLKKLDEIHNIQDGRVIDYKDIIKFGDRITMTLHAPPQWTPGTALLAGLPPAPQPDNMRKGKIGSATRHFASSSDSSESKQSAQSMIQEEIQMATSQKESAAKKAKAKLMEAPVVVEKRQLPPTIEEEPKKRQRVLNINFGFESDSDEEEDDA